MIESAGQPEADAPGATARRARIALAHDWLCGYRGGEAVLERIALLAAGLGDIAGLYTMFDDGRALSPTVDALRAKGQVRASRLSSLPGGSGALRRWLLPMYPAAVAQLSRELRRAHDREPIDLLISTSSAAIKGLEPPPGVPHVCYCHSPARYVWSQADEYGGRGLRPRLRRAGLRALGGRFRAWDRRTARNVTTFVANSTATARLIDKAFGREAAVVYPPVRTRYFTPDPATQRGDFWLLVGALEPYKKVDVAVRAARLAGRRLVIAGKGSQRGELEALARGIGAPVEFVGRVDDDRLRTLYRTASLLLFPQVEDFGITAVEAQACGLPVLARRAGGALDSVLEGETGGFFDEPTPESVARAAGLVRADAAACRASAERFSESAFDERMRGPILGALAGRGATPPLASSSR